MTNTASEIQSAAQEARTIYEAVVHFSHDGGWATAQDIHDHTGMSQGVVVFWLIRLQRMGWTTLSDDSWERGNRWRVPVARQLNTMDAMSAELAARQ
jgi:DNA-binding transcriptional ArsR family regulator